MAGDQKDQTSRTYQPSIEPAFGIGIPTWSVTGNRTHTKTPPGGLKAYVWGVRSEPNIL